ncbi:MAG: cobalamin biosynthesis protein [Pseudonocardia sp.]
MTPDLVVGLGCRPGAPAAEVRAVLAGLLDRHGLRADAVRAFATVSARAEEPGLRAVAGDGLLAFPAEVLAAVAVPHPSGRVAVALGTGSVAEAAAIHAAMLLADTGASVQLVAPKLSGTGVTAAAARIVGRGWRPPRVRRARHGHAAAGYCARCAVPGGTAASERGRCDGRRHAW